jgi:CheY-like chemotaxis protein
VAPAQVLLVDDVPAFRRLVATALRLRGGFEVVAEASDARSAVELAAAERPDVVVLDLGLPDLAGHDVIQAIRDACPESKIVVFSGWDIDAANLALVQGFVRKDDDVRRLVDVLVDVTRPPVAADATLDLADALESAAVARRFVRDRCAQWRLDAVVDDVLVVVSELVTNAVIHAQSGAELRLVLSEALLRVEVVDDGAGAPDPQLASSEDEHGRGLLLVTVLSDAWGVDATSDGRKVVWADLPLLRSAG